MTSSALDLRDVIKNKMVSYNVENTIQNSLAVFWLSTGKFEAI